MPEEQTKGAQAQVRGGRRQGWGKDDNGDNICEREGGSVGGGDDFNIIDESVRERVVVTKVPLSLQRKAKDDHGFLFICLIL